MANKNISDLDAISEISDDDEFIIVDTSVESKHGEDGTTSTKISFGDLKTDVLSQSTLDGVKGDKGDPGQKGEPGSKGEPGNQGEHGIRGNIGETGDAGEKGYKGFSGAKGHVGDIGLPGASGNRGSVGQTGQKGIKGSRGNVGEQGDVGDMGPTGLTGFTGSKGNLGQKGEPADVVVGRTGSVGTPGKKVSGIKGFKGFRGPASNERGDPGLRGPQGKSFEYESARRTFRESQTTPRKHGRVLLFLMSSGNSSSISITTNETIMKYARKRRFLVFELSNENNDLIAEKYSNLYVEVDFEPFFTFNQSPVLTKVCPVVTKLGNKVGTLAMDWYEDSSGEYHIMFFGIFTDSHETVQIPIKSVYSFTSNHLYEIISGEYENLRI